MTGPRMQSFGNRINWGKQIQKRPSDRRSPVGRVNRKRKAKTSLESRSQPRGIDKRSRPGQQKINVIIDPQSQTDLCEQAYDYAMNEDYRNLEYLLKKGVDPNECAKYIQRRCYTFYPRGGTVLRNAFFNCMLDRKFKSMKILLKYGFDLNRPIKRTLPLVNFCQNRVYLYSLGMFDTEDDIRKRRQEFVEMIEFLLRNGADINGQDSEGNTCLHHMIRCTDTFYFRYIEDKGGDRTILNNEGEDPREYYLSFSRYIMFRNLDLENRILKILYTSQHSLQDIVTMKLEVAGGESDLFSSIVEPYTL